MGNTAPELTVINNDYPQWKSANASLELKPGYQVSSDGHMRGPQGKPVRLIQKHSRWYVSVVRASGQNTTLPLAKVVLATFAGFEPNRAPEFCDNNPLNCRADNLVWSEQPRKRSSSVPRKKTSRSRRRVAQPRSVVVVKAYRVYEADGVLMCVQDSGEAILSTGDGTTLTLAPAQLTALGEIMARVSLVKLLLG